MPSRERAITTITEGDSENEEPIISEVIEILDDGDSGEHEPTSLLSLTLTEDVSLQEVETLPNTPSLKENNSGVKSKVVSSKSICTTNKEIAPSPTVSTIPSTSNSKFDKKSSQRTLDLFFRKPAKSSSSAGLPRKCKNQNPGTVTNHAVFTADIMAIVLGNSFPTDTHDIVSQTPTHDSQTTVCGVLISALLPELVTRDRHESGKKRTKAKKSPSRGNKAKKARAVIAHSQLHLHPISLRS